jgi:putative transposase
MDFRPGYRIRDQNGVYFVTFQVIYWIDVFSRQTYKDIFIDSLKYCQKEKGLKVYAFVIMTNHVHMIISSDDKDLSDIIRDLKTHTSKAIIKQMQSPKESRRRWMLALFEFAAKKHKRNSIYQFWTHENHPIALETNHFIKEKLDYIHNNPVKSGMVYNSWEYVYSSASNYTGMKGIIDIDLV